MTTEIKTKIIEALEVFMNEHELSQSDIAEMSAVNSSYLIRMRRGQFFVGGPDKPTPITDKYFIRVADVIGFSAEKQYWEVKPTPQMKTALSVLRTAKSTGEVAVIIGETGAGKTFAVDLFRRKHPKEVFTIKVGSSDSINAILDKIIANFLSVPEGRLVAKSVKIKTIITELKKIAERGLEPILILDEAEYMRLPALCAFKELYDTLNTLCSLVLIGTPQLIKNIDRGRLRDKSGIPQLYRRIKFKIRYLPTVDRRYTDFIGGLEVGLQNWLKSNCDNYGELHDVLVPAMREAEARGVELTEEFVRTTLRA